MLIDLDETQIQYLRCVLSEDLDRNEDHIRFLQSAEDEEDRDLQVAESENAIRQSRAILAVLGPSPSTPASPEPVNLADPAQFERVAESSFSPISSTPRATRRSSRPSRPATSRTGRRMAGRILGRSHRRDRSAAAPRPRTQRAGQGRRLTA